MAVTYFPWQEMAYIQHDKCWFHISAVPASIGGHLRSLHSASASAKKAAHRNTCEFEEDVDSPLMSDRLNGVNAGKH